MPPSTLTIPFRVRPIRPGFLQKVRQQGVDDLNQPVEKHVAAGGEPCRDVLRGALPGEELILASYCPFETAGPYKEYGPVFVLAQPSAAPLDLAGLPIGEDQAYFTRTFVLRAYSRAERITDAVLTLPQDAERNLHMLLANPDVAFVLARFAGYGCYGCRVERL